MRQTWSALEKPTSSVPRWWLNSTKKILSLLKKSQILLICSIWQYLTSLQKSIEDLKLFTCTTFLLSIFIIVVFISSIPFIDLNSNCYQVVIFACKMFNKPFTQSILRITRWFMSWFITRICVIHVYLIPKLASCCHFLIYSTC